MSTRARFVGQSARFLPHGTEGRAEEADHPTYYFAPDGSPNCFKVHEKELEWLEPRSTVPDLGSENTLLTALCSRPDRGRGERTMIERTLTAGLRVRTAFLLATDGTGLLVTDRHLRPRRPDTEGALHKPIPGTCGDGWFVIHEGGRIAGYWLTELAVLPEKATP